MATVPSTTLALFSQNHRFSRKPKQTPFFFLVRLLTCKHDHTSQTRSNSISLGSWGAKGLYSAGLALALVGPASAAGLPLLGELSEPANALSLPTWTVHVSSVIEWITAMVLVWEYGEKSGFESWKGLSWGMVPLLGGAFCACTWHFFYNSESLEVLVALQAALTVLGNATMCLAAFRIYKAMEDGSNSL
ncbi:hypothetical protein K2173_021687 [Erythroxylum novogranatense]|uniref:Ycf49-like protein n=1 Tax=Erythroxylum novogranatense TaxID=1862640 RepID=A0AAV8TJH9_9ROSI|nr:hypothetical protein K2173_021687 [Erythroxylum novogranatense]